MNTVTIQLKKKQYVCQVPEQFSDLTIDQYIAYIERVLMQPQPISERPADKLYLLLLFMDYKGGTLPTKIWDELAETGQAQDLFPLLDFLSEAPPVTGQWFIPKLYILNQWHHAPKTNFEGMTFGEFIYADMIATSITEEDEALEEQEKLAELAAILLRKRRAFKSEEVKNRKQTMRWLQPAVLYAIFFNFLAVRQWVVQLYPNLFKKGQQQDENIQLGGNSVNLSWLSIRRKIAGDVLRLQEVDDKDLHDLFYALNEQIVEDKEKA